MREIKFRAWEIDWYNKVLKSTQGRMIQWEDIRDDFATVQAQKSKFILMQYTGLKDKNGKDIYEGDLFGKFGGDKERPGEYEIHGQIKFDTDFAMFVIELTNGGWMELFDYMNNRQNQREIIGNIYENPELLK